MSAKRSPSLADNWRTMCGSAPPSTLMPRCAAVLSTGHVEEECAMHTDTSGGSRETEVNELIAIPVG